MLAIARSWGVPSRYVSGYVHREGREGEQSLPRRQAIAGASSTSRAPAGWASTPPTTPSPTTVSSPWRWAATTADACPTRGTLLGGGGSTLDVEVTVTADGETAPHRSPDRGPHREWPNVRAVSPTPHEFSGGFDQ